MGEAIEVYKGKLTHLPSDTGSFLELATALHEVGVDAAGLQSRDAWGNELVYRRDEIGSYSVISLGADGRPGPDPEVKGLARRPEEDIIWSNALLAQWPDETAGQPEPDDRGRADAGGSSESAEENSLESRRQRVTERRIAILGQCVERYKQDHGNRVPLTDDPEVLIFMLQAGGIPLDPRAALDGWGNKFIYRYDTSNRYLHGYTVISLGSDGAVGPALEKPGEVRCFEEDIVWSDGSFVQQPVGPQSHVNASAAGGITQVSPEQETTVARMTRLGQELERYKNNHEGEPPVAADADELRRLLHGEFFDQAGVEDPDLAQPEFALDGWGNSLVFQVEGSDYRLVSYGSDGRPGPEPAVEGMVGRQQEDLVFGDGRLLQAPAALMPAEPTAAGQDEVLLNPPALLSGAERQSLTMERLRVVGEAIETYRTQHGAQAPRAEDVFELFRVLNEDGLHIDARLSRDGWANHFLYSYDRAESSNYTLSSGGSDGQFGPLPRKLGEVERLEEDIIWENGDFTQRPADVRALEPTSADETPDAEAVAEEPRPTIGTPEIEGLRILGSGTPELTEAGARWAGAFFDFAGVVIRYQPIGNRAGISSLLNGVADFALSDAPSSADRLRIDELVQFPIALGGVELLVNLPGLAGETLNISPSLLADIYLGKVTRWRDEAVSKLNPDIELPDLEISVVRMSEERLAARVFSEYLAKVSRDWRAAAAAEGRAAWPAGAKALNGRAAIELLQRREGAIGFVEHGRQVPDGLVLVSLRNRAGRFVKPSRDAIRAAAVYSSWQGPESAGFYLTDQPGAESWPLVVVYYALVRKSHEDGARIFAALSYFHWCLTSGAADDPERGLVALPEAVVKRCEDTWRREISVAAKAVWR